MSEPAPEPTPADLVRFLVNDPKTDYSSEVFSDAEIAGYLALEGGNVKRAAAQAIDTIADNEILASKVLRDHERTTDGAKVGDALRKRAASLRAQADEEDANSEDGFFFDVVDIVGDGRDPELTETWQP